MEKNQVSNVVIAVVADVLGSHHYNHTKLNTIFAESGAPGEPPTGNCVKKCEQWLKRCNSDPAVDGFVVLGGVLERFMEAEIPAWQSGCDRVNKVLAKYGLSYHRGGQILGGSVGPSSKSLQAILKGRDLPAVEIEFERALMTVESDPAAALTAACSLVESLCKVYIEDQNLELPSKETIKNLWKVVSKDLQLDPGSVVDQDITRILSGMTSIVDGIGSLRTHAGSAHGRGRKQYRVEGRHARLTIHAAHTLAVFILETWEARKSTQI